MLGILRFPLWLISRLFGKRKRKVREERKEKQRKYVRNFSEGRLKNVSWQKSIGRDKKKKYKKRKFSRKKTNNFSGG